MEKACVLSDSEKASSFFESFLREYGCDTVRVTSDVALVKRSLNEWGMDVCLINAPISGHNAQDLARELARDGTCQIMFFIKSDYCDDIAADLGQDGIIVIEKPIHPQTLSAALRIVDASAARLLRMHHEVKRMQSKLDETKVVARAKCVLIEKKGMSEQEAHHYIEKQAMDRRESKRTVAEDILDYYD